MLFYVVDVAVGEVVFVLCAFGCAFRVFVLVSFAVAVMASSFVFVATYVAYVHVTVFVAHRLVLQCCFRVGALSSVLHSNPGNRL